MAKEYKVVFQATVDASQLQKEADKALSGKKFNMNMKGMGTTAKSSAGMLGEFNAQLRNLSSTIPKVAAFGVATIAINAFTDAIRSSIDAVFEMDAALVEFRKVSNLTGEALDDFTDRATQVGLEVARTGSEVIAAATEFRKSGFGDEQSLELARLASMFQNVADSEVDAGEAAGFITSQIKAFNFEAQDYEHILDAINEVSNNFAVSSTDISTALSKTSAAMSVLGNSFEETIALVTAGTEILTGQASKVARGLRTIGNNIANVANDVGTLTYQVQGTTKNIQLIDESTGDLKSTFQVLGEIAENWDKMSTAEQQAVGIALAGKNQFEVFSATVGNFDQAIKASETALNSQGSAAKENAKYMEGLEAAVANFKAEWQALANSLISSDFIKFFIDAGTAVLKFANNDIVQLVAKVGLFVALMPTAIGLLDKLYLLIINNPVGAAIVGVGLAATAIIKWLDKINVSFEELSDKIEENKTQIQQYQSEIDSLESKETKLTDAEEARLATLKSQTEEIEKQNAELRKQQQERLLGATTVVGYETRGGGLSFSVQRESTYDITKAQLEQASSLKDLDDATVDYIDDIITLASEMESAGEPLDKNLQLIIDLYNNLVKLDEEQRNSNNTTSQTTSVAQAAVQALQSQNAEFEKSWNAIQDLVNAEQQLRNGQALTEQQIISLIIKYPTLIGYVDAMRKGELSAADAMRALAKQSLNTSKTVIANSKAEAQAVYNMAKAEVDAYNAAMIARAKAGGSVAISGGMAEALATLSQAKRQLDMFTDATYYASDATSSASGSTSKLNDETKELTSSLKDEANALTEAADLMISKLDLEIDALEQQKDAIQEANDALEDQIELEEALDALARAKSKRVLVYQGGQFQYATDTAAVGEAQKQLNETQRKQAQQAQLDAIDERINAIEAEQDTWRNVSKAYDEYLGKQALGIDQEAQNWQDRLGQAQLFANKYLEIMKTIADVESGKLSMSQGQAIISQAKNFSGTLPKSTSTLLDPMQASMASWSSINSMASPSYSSIGGGGTTVIQQFGNIVLPNVTNANQFVEELSNYSQFAVQAATVR